MALGASTARVVGPALASGVLPFVFGLASGMARLTSSYLFEVTPMDPDVFSAVTAVFLTVAIASNYIRVRLGASVAHGNTPTRVILGDLVRLASKS